MYGIPAGETFAFLVGRRLDQLCFGRYQLQLRFDKAVTVSVESDLGVRSPGSTEVIVEDTRDAAAILVAALATCVTVVEVHGSRSFSMTFEGGLSLRVIDGEESYESFQVHHGENVIVV